MKIIRLSEVLSQTGLSRATVYRFMAEKKFPPRRKLGEKSVGWVATEIETWLENRPLID